VASSDVVTGSPTISDYGTSTSSGTSKDEADLKICFGIAENVSGNGSQAITNLPFSSSSSYQVTTASNDSDTGIEQDASGRVVKNSSSQFTIYNSYSSATDISWIAIGT